MIMTGLEKVEFIRSENYLTKLAVLINQLEKDNFRLANQANRVTILEGENESLKAQIKVLKREIANSSISQ